MEKYIEDLLIKAVIRFGKERNKNYEKSSKKIKELILQNKFKYVVINTNYLNKVDLDGLKYLIEIFNYTNNLETNLVVCDKNNIFKGLLNNNIPSINEEIEVL